MDVGLGTGEGAGSACQDGAACGERGAAGGGVKDGAAAWGCGIGTAP
ncbi:hypothetical protein [Methylobacterium aquaticum]|nr:hypothetical protein [Methylobacterium aquaticum]